MPKKTLSPRALPAEIQFHVRMWGQAIKCHRIEQRLTGAQLADQINVSIPTVSRMEKGDPGVSAGTYLNAMSKIGLLAKAAPTLKYSLWHLTSKQRVRPTFDEWGERLDSHETTLDPPSYS
jgi:transcriptional regulator with XRE-family HTH domain